VVQSMIQGDLSFSFPSINVGENLFDFYMDSAIGMYLFWLSLR